MDNKAQMSNKWTGTVPAGESDSGLIAAPAANRPFVARPPTGLVTSWGGPPAASGRSAGPGSAPAHHDPEAAMQYFTPGGGFFAGDCMPFSHDGVFHLYYLWDEQHHQGLGGLGGHQWAHASSTDLRQWTHHPLALPITAEWEGSICTGSVSWHDGLYHAFYATRRRDRTQHLGHAVSRDGIAFEKLEPNPFASPPEGYSPYDCRDPFVFRDPEGRFQMLVTARLADPPLHDRGGCLLRYSSADLTDWRVEGPLLLTGRRGHGGVPECPDWFAWNGWYYLLFGMGLGTHYRMAREPLGPWLRPAVDLLVGPTCAVMKTAPFGDRRMGVGWIGSRQDDRDSGRLLWAGNVVFRELLQHADGTLGTRFVPELGPATGPALSPTWQALTAGATSEGEGVTLRAAATLEAAQVTDLPRDCRLRCRLVPGPGAARFGLGLRGRGAFASAVELSFEPAGRRLALADQSLPATVDLASPVDLEIVMVEDLIDVCVGGCQCVINRLPEQTGDRLFAFGEGGEVRVEGLVIEPLAPR